MEPQASGSQPAGDAKEAVRAKRAGGSCITLFVVFLISLLSFGHAPWNTVAEGQGGRLNFNLISCLGVVIAIYGVIFLATGLKRVLRLTTAKKVMGLVGGAGLAVHLVLALFLPLNSAPTGPAGTGGNTVLGQSGPEQWTVDGKTYEIASTYYLALPDGLQYTIEFPYQFTQADGQMNDQQAIGIVYPLMKHAVQSGAFQRMQIRKLGEGSADPTRIGVAPWSGRKAGRVDTVCRFP